MPSCGDHCATVYLINYCLDHSSSFLVLLGGNEKFPNLFDSVFSSELALLHFVDGLTNVLKKLHVFLVRFSKFNRLYGRRLVR